ncbi:hypothetical protein TIFTF001_048337 [Ficus carica]|uniref:Uncharacterized protein n=1 Tax=Ficus carica TaxID=3494 RepID=A0AA87ZJL1_FICCA|nr:hypothetical protein TIFTF001_048324 [Ficus carica]GMN34196.1 hypothetical protein TIFTF001_048327 [Ficus carica]GMN34210.1 hypothetical protein TIFTF001_048334 [Ficus carica]GMN34240.1 hypothetical protein TIFTF001_048337 [Ficus carica]
MGAGSPSRSFASVARTATKPVASTAIPVTRPADFVETARAIVRPLTRQLHQDYKARHKTSRLHGVVSAETTRLTASVGRSSNRFLCSAN